MWNTCSIGRGWKSREGWSRPVLTGERGTLSNPCLVGWVSSCGGFLVGWQGALFSCGHETKDRSVLFASVVRFPDRHDRNRGWFRCRPIPWWVGRVFGFAVVMAQVRRPVPFRTRKLRPGRGDGTALERVWESSTPPHSTSEDPPVESRGGIPGGSSSCFRGFPLGVTLREPLFLLFCRPAGRASLPGIYGRLFLFPVGSVCFELPKGIFVIPQRLLVNRYFFRNVLLTRYMIRFVKRNR